MKQSTTLLTIDEIFKDRFFKIPDYQRGFSWETAPQLHDLKDDIENLFKRDHRHFTGTIVAAIDKKNHHFNIVDGQQRLTSILILLKVIWETDKVKFSEIPDLYFKRGAVGEERSVLEPNEETREFFNDLFHNGIIPTPKIKSEKNILDAYRYFQKWVIGIGV